MGSSDPTSIGIAQRPKLRDKTPHLEPPVKTVPDPTLPHCAAHSRFRADCVVCNRARANFQPYPIRQTTPVPRSFGFTDDLTAEKLRALRPGMRDIAAGYPEFSLSFLLLRMLRRLVWPF